MSRESSTGPGRILSFLFAFTVLFVLVFGLGVFVGKRLGRQELKITNTFEEAPPEPTAVPQAGLEEQGDEGIAESPAPAVEEAAVETPAPSAPPEEAETSAETEKEVKATEPPKVIETAPPAKPDERLAEVNASDRPDGRVYRTDRVFSGPEAGEQPRELSAVERVPRVYKIHDVAR